MKKTIKSPLFWVLIIFLVLSGIYLFNLDEEEFFANEDVVVEVNGVEFSFDDFNRVLSQVQQQYMMQGMELSEEELREIAVESLVQQALLMELADEKNIDVSQEELEDYFQEIMTMYGMDNEEELLGQLKEEGLDTRAEVDEVLTSEIRVDKLVELFAEDVDVTQEEVEEAYNLFAQQVEEFEGAEQVPSFEEVEEEIKESLIQEKVVPVILTKLEEMEESAEIKTYFEEVSVEEAPSDVEMLDPEELEIEMEELE